MNLASKQYDLKISIRNFEYFLKFININNLCIISQSQKYNFTRTNIKINITIHVLTDKHLILTHENKQQDDQNIYT